MNEIEIEQLRRAKEERYRYFLPNGKSEEFIKTVGSLDYFVTLFNAANGVGKTATAVNMLAHLFWPCDNAFFQSRMFQRWEYPKRGRIVTEPNSIDTIVRELEYWFPKGRYTQEKKGKHYPKLWITDTGWEFEIMSYDQDPKEFESATVGFCIEENERVLLEDGRWIPIKDIKVGDVVWNTTDRWKKKKCRVAAKWEKGEREIVEVKTRSGYSIKCTPDHKVWVNNRGWVEAGKLQKGDRLYSPQFSFGGKDTITNSQAFMLGAWIGDGWFSKSLFLATANEVFLGEVRSKVGQIKHKQRYDYRIVDKSLRELIITTGLSDKKAYSKFIPDLIFTQTQENIIEFLVGMYATDGWFSGHSVGYGTTSNRLANDLRFLLHNLGIRASIVKKKSQKPGVWRDQWFVLISQKHNVKKFCELVKVESKKEMQDKVYKEAVRRIGSAVSRDRYKKDTRKIVTEVRSVGRAKVYDIAVEGEHSFICNGLRVSNCWLDEPPPESIYKACVARLRMGGLVFITATPLAGSEWMYDQIICNAEKGKGLRTYLTATVEDACKTHGIRGHLDHEHIEKIVAQYSDDEKQARVFGKFQHLTGLVFKQFEHRIHVIKPFMVDMNNYSVVHYLDPHPRNPDAVLWLAIDRNNTKYVIDELYLKCTGGTKELATIIKQKDSMYRVIDRRIDPSALIEDQHTQASLVKRLGDYGIQYKEATKARTLADRRIMDALSYQEHNGEMIVSPELYIFDNCQRTIWEFNHYRWDEWRGKSADSHSPKQKPLDKDDHMIENLGRSLFAEHRFVPYVKPRTAYYAPVTDPYA